MDQMVDLLNKDMANTNEDADIAFYDLKDFVLKNEAQLEEGDSYDSLLEREVQPTLTLRKTEAEKLILAAVSYMEEYDYKMHEACQNLVNWFKELAKCLDEQREKKKQADIEF